MNNNFKNDKFVEVVQEFQIVQGQSVYQIGSIDLKDVYFFVKNGNENYKVLATGQYTVDGVNLTINDPNIILTNTHIQVCRVYSTVASKYISDVVNINTLREHYNVLVDDFINVIDFLRKSGIKSDSSAMNYVFPLLEEGQVFMRKGLGFEGRQIMDINAELQRQIDIAITFFEDYMNNQKKPEIDAYTVSKKQELETYTIAKKGEINTLVTRHKTDINTLADTKKTEITDVTTVKKQEIETLTAQKKVQITDHTDLEIQKILALGVDNLQTQINTNKSDILLKANKSDILNKENTIEDLIKSRKYEVGDVVQVLGYYSAGDGGGHKRQKKPVGYNGADAVIGADGSKWGIVHSGWLCSCCFGIKGSIDFEARIDETDLIDKFLNWCASNSIVSVFEKKYYFVSRKITIENSVQIRAVYDEYEGFNTNATETLPMLMMDWGSQPTTAILEIKPKQFGEIISGGYIEGITFHCNFLAEYGLVLDNTIEFDVSGVSMQSKSAGLLICSHSGNTSNFSMRNRVKRWRHVWGVDPNTQPNSSHGILIQGNINGSVATTQQTIDEVYGLVHNGYLVEVQHSDNCHFKILHGNETGNGGTIHLSNVNAEIVQGSNNNIIDYAVGKIRLDYGLYGNIFKHVVTEGTHIETQDNFIPDSKTVSYDTIVNYTNGEFYTTSKKMINKEIFLKFEGSDTLAGIHKAKQISPNERVSSFKIYEYLDRGQIDGYSLIVASNETINGASLKTEFLFKGTGDNITTPTISNLITTGVLNQHTIKKLDYRFSNLNGNNLQPTNKYTIPSTPFISCNIENTGATNIFVLGVIIYYRSYGIVDDGSSKNYNFPTLVKHSFNIIE